MLDISALQYNAENPNLITVIYTVLSALGLGILIAFTYRNTTHPVMRQNHFVQALVLVTVVAATIIQAIGDSVARGLGMLGALSIIRFRTTVRDPRNIVFIFSAIAAGIACGVFGFLIAFVGTVVFCLTAFLLKFTAPTTKQKLRGTLDVNIMDQSNTSIKDVEAILSKSTSTSTMTRERIHTNGKRENSSTFRFLFVLYGKYSLRDLRDQLESIEGLTITNIELDNPSMMEL